MENAWLSNFVKFIRVLRAAGVRVSLSESVDAAQALSCIDILARDRVKAALSACLAKSEAERDLFSAAFDRFFIDPETKDAYISHQSQAREQKKQEVLQQASELQYQGQELDIGDELKEVYTRITAQERQSILEFLDRSSTGKNMPPRFKPITENVIKGRLNQLKNKYGSLSSHRSVFDYAVSEAGILAEDVLDSVREENSLMYQNLSAIGDRDMPAVIRLIKSLAEKMRKRARSRQQTLRRSGLDFKRTISNGMATGGIPFQLKYKTKRGQKQRLITLCDVSSSMYRFSGFVLNFIACLHAEAAAADHYIFSTDVEHLNVRQFTTSANIEREITKSKVWKQGTDISCAIRHILRDRFVVLNSSTSVIIVSDAKTLNAADAAEGMKQLGAKVKKIYWLNPVQEPDWASIAGIEGLRRHCIMLDCSTLEKLSKACEGFGNRF